jgi:hypothetical protein
MDDPHHAMGKPLQVFIPHVYLLDKVFGCGIKWEVRTSAIRNLRNEEMEGMIRLSPEKSNNIIFM